MVRDVGILESRLFLGVEEDPINHLRYWCKEFMAAYSLGCTCFDTRDFEHEYAKRVLTYRFKQMFVHGSIVNYKDSLDFEIDWKTNVQHKKGIPANFTQDMAAFMGDELEFFEKLNRCQAKFPMQAFVNNLDNENDLVYSDDIKVGECTGVISLVEQLWQCQNT